jgi:predicted MPP superfamily phosphohydrolase
MKKNSYSSMIVALVMFFIMSGAATTVQAAFTDSTFSGSIILGRPDNGTITASITSITQSQVYLAWGENKGKYTGKSAVKEASASKPAVIVMNGLKGNMVYYYRLFFKDSGETQFKNTTEYSFRTPRSTGAKYSFVVQSDSHLLNKADKDIYTKSMQTIAGFKPDFMFDLGDTFLHDQVDNPQYQDYETVRKATAQQLLYFDTVTRNVPLFLTMGNHEGEYGFFLDGTNKNLTVMSTLARTTYYPNPVPNSFYTGNTQKEAFVGQPQNYYAFTWGDALYVSIDPYRYLTADPYNDKDGWQWTLGKTQYDWFKKTLETSKAKYKFVFSHHAIGNVRGGLEVAKLYEWGGYDKNGKYLFDEKRPGWGKPIQKIMKDSGVTVFFQGHDHLFARETVDGVVYQTLPKPAEKVADQQSNYVSYPDADVLMNSGILKIDVSPANVQVNYYRNYFVSSEPQAGNTGAVYSYTVDSSHNVKVLKSTKDDLTTYGGSTGNSGNTVNNKTKKKDKTKNPTPPKNNSSKTDNSSQTNTGVVTATNLTSVPEGGFSFAIEADPHWDENAVDDLVKVTFANIKSADPSLMFDLGDTSMAEKLARNQSEVESRFAKAKSFFDLLGGLPIYSVLGNHDGESGENPARASLVRPLRQQLFPLPPSTSNFSGNIKTANYYTFVKNNVQFFVLDPFTFTTEKIGQTNNNWASTLGKTQYDWLKNTLASSKAQFKFVYIHNLVGGISKDQRGGSEAAEFFEWGGENASGVDEFSKMRPGWDAPIHDLLVKYGVNIVFHGHDHFYAKQEKDGIIYQLVPQPGTPGNSINSAPDYGYVNGTFLPSVGYLRVVVTNENVTVGYVKSSLDRSINGSIANIYSIKKEQ